ncbi:MAG: M14 family zinc carboxypeptidase [Thermoguttaceae bacterium]
MVAASGAAFAPASAAFAQASHQAPEAPRCWLVAPSQTEPKIRHWAEHYPQLVRLDAQKTFGGRVAYALTVTDQKIPDHRKVKVLFSQPHAHEPAATAGMMNFVAQLLEGTELDGRRSQLDRQRILSGCLLSFIPDGNPDGRARAPVAWWDGSQYSNQQFLDIAFGQTAAGQRAPRVGRWSTKDQAPARIGIVYEQIDSHQFVEPNRDLQSSFFRLIHRLRARHQYDLHVELHQTEFEKSPYQAMVILPFAQKELPPRIRQANQEAAEAVLRAWQSSGARAQPEARPLGYGEDQLQYFRKCWTAIYETTPVITIEIQNNSPRTPPDMQRKLMETAIRAAIEWALPGQRPGGVPSGQ